MRTIFDLRLVYIAALQVNTINNCVCGYALNTRQFLKPAVKVTLADILSKLIFLILCISIGFGFFFFVLLIGFSLNSTFLFLTLGIIIVCFYCLPIAICILPVILIEKKYHPIAVIKHCMLLAYGRRWWIWGQLLLLIIGALLFFSILGLLIHLLLGDSSLVVFHSITWSILFVELWLSPFYALFVYNFMLLLYYALREEQTNNIIVSD